MLRVIVPEQALLLRSLTRSPTALYSRLSPLNHTFDNVGRKELSTQGIEERKDVRRVFVNDRSLHIRVLSLYLTGQSTYWSVLVGESYFAPVEEATESLSMFTSVVTSPFWPFAGFACSLMMWGMGYSYTSHLVSSVSLVGKREVEVEVATFNLLGGVTEPESYPLSEVKFLGNPPEERDRYVSVKVGDNRLNLLLDRKKGKFFPDGVVQTDYTGVTEEEQQKRMLEVSRKLGAAWLDATPSVSLTKKARAGGDPVESLHKPSRKARPRSKRRIKKKR